MQIRYFDDLLPGTAYGRAAFEKITKAVCHFLIIRQLSLKNKTLWFAIEKKRFMIYPANSQEWVSTQNIKKGPVRVKEGNQMKRPKYFWNETMGKRFKLFRQLVEKSRSEMAAELNQTPDYISGIEEGNILPTLDDISELNISYGLNCGWLLFGKVNIFLDKGPKTSDHAYLMGILAQYGGMELYVPRTKKQIPAELNEIIRKIQHFIKNKQQLPGNQVEELLGRHECHDS